LISVNITITGGSGFIGRRLLKTLGADGHALHVLSRHAGTNMPAGVRISAWDPNRTAPPAEALRDADVVVSLAGEPVAQRWTVESKRRIRESRVNGTRHLVEAMAALPRRPAALISASAIGYYGSRGDEILTEASPAGTGFLPEVCVEWEKEALAAQAIGMRVALVRTGIVLDQRGGALQRMLPPFRMGVGGKLGDGSQWMSWIHLDDLVGLFRHAILNPVQGPFNGVAPNPVANTGFTRALAGALHRPAVFPMPKFALSALFGEMSSVLLSSQRVLPKAAETAGYSFRFPELNAALADVLK
jgi:uncharacterized protein (TIGR01777 family)